MSGGSLGAGGEHGRPERPAAPIDTGPRFSDCPRGPPGIRGRAGPRVGPTVNGERSLCA